MVVDSIILFLLKLGGKVVIHQKLQKNCCGQTIMTPRRYHVTEKYVQNLFSNSYNIEVCLSFGIFKIVTKS